MYSKYIDIVKLTPKDTPTSFGARTFHISHRRRLMASLLDAIFRPHLIYFSLQFFLFFLFFLMLVSADAVYVVLLYNSFCRCFILCVHFSYIRPFKRRIEKGNAVRLAMARKVAFVSRRRLLHGVSHVRI